MVLILCKHLFPLKKKLSLKCVFSARLDCRGILGRFDNSGRDHHQGLSISGFIEIHFWTMCRFQRNICRQLHLQAHCGFAGLFEEDTLMIYTLARGSYSPPSHFVIFIPEINETLTKSSIQDPNILQSSNQDPNLLQSCQVGGCSGTEVCNF